MQTGSEHGTSNGTHMAVISTRHSIEPLVAYSLGIRTAELWRHRVRGTPVLRACQVFDAAESEEKLVIAHALNHAEMA